MTVSETTVEAIKQITNAEETKYETYDDFVRAAAEKYGHNNDIFSKDVQRALKEGWDQLRPPAQEEFNDGGE